VPGSKIARVNSAKAICKRNVHEHFAAVGRKVVCMLGYHTLTQSESLQNVDLWQENENRSKESRQAASAAFATILAIHLPRSVRLTGIAPKSIWGGNYESLSNFLSW